MDCSHSSIFSYTFMLMIQLRLSKSCSRENVPHVTQAEPCCLYLVNGSTSNIEHVTDFKLLGVTLDQYLLFNRQIEELCKKLAKRIGLLRHIGPYLKRNQRDICYSTIFRKVEKSRASHFPCFAHFSFGFLYHDGFIFFSRLTVMI